VFSFNGPIHTEIVVNNKQNHEALHLKGRGLVIQTIMS
jgi:hypothetical protein